MANAIFLTVQALLANAGVSAIVADRIAPAKGDVSLPDLVIMRVSEENYSGLAKESGTRQARVSIQCRAKTSTQSDKLGEAVVAALNNLYGKVTGANVQFRKGVTDVSDFNDDASIFRRTIDFYVTFSDAA